LSKYIKAEITENTPLNKNHNLLVLSSSAMPKNHVPGQFYMIGTSASYDPLLKRPLSILRETSSDKNSGELRFLYRIKGKGTLMLKGMKKGEILNLLGPLGNGYPLSHKDLTPVLIAGGIGIASLFPLAEKLGKKACLIYGGRTKDELIMMDELKDIPKELIISTDDGSLGEKGTVINALNNFLSYQPSSASGGISHQLIYACGPTPMLKAISEFATQKGIKGYISVEENMACGVGACLGCTVKTKKGYKRVCKEGPVFPIGEIVWT